MRAGDISRLVVIQCALFGWLCLTMPVASAANALCAKNHESIETIQGQAEHSAFVGKEVTIKAVVSAVFTDKNLLQGFFVQQADKNPLASHGLFIYHRGSVQVGDELVLKGQVKEYYDLTELVNVSILTTCARGLSIPALTIAHQLPNKKRESLEGVLVQLPAGQVSRNDQLLRFGQLGVQARWPEYSLVSSVEPEQLGWLIDDASHQTNPEHIAYLTGLHSVAQLSLGAKTSPIEGVVSFSFGRYQLLATGPVQFEHALSLPKKPTQALRLASFNVENYFNGNGLGQQFLASRGAKNTAQLKQQTQQLAAVIKSLAADIWVFNEIENDGYDRHSAVTQLLAEVNAAKVHSPFVVVKMDASQTGSRAISNAIVFNPDQVEAVGQVRSILTFASWPVGLHRPFVAQKFRARRSGQEFYVVAGHLKSKAGHCANDTALLKEMYGACSVERQQAVQELDKWLASFVDAMPVWVLGDFNALANEPAVLTMLQQHWQSPFDLTKQHSYVYRGQANLLDYIWYKPGNQRVQILSKGYWPINSGAVYNLDEFSNHPQFSKLTRPLYLGASDHDPVFVDIQ